MSIFNKNNNGAQELVEVLGMIDTDTDFSKWQPYIPLSARKLSAIIGPEVYNQTVQLYQSDTTDGPELELIRRLQQCIALFTWVKIIPTLDAQHGNAGRQKRLGEGEKGLTAIQEYKDEANILNLAYEAVDLLIAFLEEQQFEFWATSAKKRSLDKLLIRSKEQFDEYYTIGSHRLFFTLVPIIKEVQDRHILPVITLSRMNELLAGDDSAGLLATACRPIALLTIKKAVERLPIEVLPEGIVQIQQVGTVKEKLKAEEKARIAVATSLGNDAAIDLMALQDIIAKLEAAPDEPDYYIPKPTVQNKGITF